MGQPILLQLIDECKSSSDAANQLEAAGFANIAYVVRKLASCDAQDLVDATDEMMRHDYESSIRTYDEAIAQAQRQGKIKNDDALEDHLRTICAGSKWVAEESKSRYALRYSSNGGAWSDEFGTDEVVDGTAASWTGMAFAALRQDILDQLQT